MPQIMTCAKTDEGSALFRPPPPPLYVCVIRFLHGVCGAWCTCNGSSFAEWAAKRLLTSCCFLWTMALSSSFGL